MSPLPRTATDDRFWLAAHLALLGLVSAAFLAALALG
jgi:hypothetical protein